MQEFKNTILEKVQAVEEGESSAMELMGQLKSLETFIKQEIAIVESHAMDEFENECQGQKTIKNFKGFEVTVRRGGWTYDYSNVPAYKAATDNVKALGEKYKALMEHAESVDPETGEILDIRKKPRKDSISFKPSKEI